MKSRSRTILGLAQIRGKLKSEETYVLMSEETLFTQFPVYLPFPVAGPIKPLPQSLYSISDSSGDVKGGSTAWGLLGAGRLCDPHINH